MAIMMLGSWLRYKKYKLNSLVHEGGADRLTGCWKKYSAGYAKLDKKNCVILAHFFLRSRMLWKFIVLMGSMVSLSYGKVQEECVPCAREGGFMGLNLGYSGGVVQNKKVTGIGSKLALLDVEIPQGPLGIGKIFPEELEKFRQAGFIVGLETGYTFKISGNPGAGWALEPFVNGSLSTTRGKASFPGTYSYVNQSPDVPGVAFQENLIFRNKGFWSTGFRLGPLIQRMFYYIKGGFMMTRMSMSIQRNALTRLVVPSRTLWFPGTVVGLGAEFQLTSVCVIGLDFSINFCTQKRMTVAFPDLGGAVLADLRPTYTHVLFTLKYKFPLKAQIQASSNRHSVYRPSW